jgi:hypothetical protein
MTGLLTFAEMHNYRAGAAETGSRKADRDRAADVASPREVRLSGTFAVRVQQTKAAGCHDGL